jgi:hypothetical protein
MQQMKEPPPASERSRRRPPRRRSADPVPIPDRRSPPRRKRTVKLQEVLKAYQRAVVEVLEQRIEEASRASAHAARQAVAEALAERQGLDDGEVTKGVVAYADERFQALSVRLDRIEEALRRLAGERPGPPPSDPEDEGIERQLDSIAQAVAGLAANHQQLDDQLGRRTGQGVVAVAQVIRKDLGAIKRDLASLREWMQDMDTSVRSMHRTLAWEGMRAPRPGPNEPSPQ